MTTGLRSSFLYLSMVRHIEVCFHFHDISELMPSSWRNSQPFHELQLLRLHCIFMLGIQSYAPQPDDQLSYHITSLEESAASTTQRYACMHVWMNE